MCGRFALYALHAELAEILRIVDFPADYEPRYNIAPTQDAWVVRVAPSGQRSVDLLRWGLIPSWAKGISIGARLINARSESAAQKPSFRASFKSKRCIVPASGFFEWQTTSGTKQPYYINPSNGPVICMAGLWDQWIHDETGEHIESFTILTTAANVKLAPLHHRMPVILDQPSSQDAWLDPALDGDEALLGELCQPANDETLRFHTVSTLVNSPRNDEARCIEKSAPEQRGLFT